MIGAFILTTFFQVPSDGPSVSTVAIALSGVVMLALIKVTVDNRDESRTYRQLLFGVTGESEKTGLVAQVTKIAEQIETLSDEVKGQRRSIRDEVINAATVVTAQAQVQFAEKIDELSRKVDVLADRRFESRPKHRE